MRRSALIAMAVALLASAGCDSGASVTMQAAEKFRWCTDGPEVSFGPPPSPWQRSKHQERETGIAFVYRDVPPGLITAGEITNLCRHDSRPALRELYERFDEFSPHEFQKALHAARRFENSGYSYAADEMITRVNKALTEAAITHRQQDLSTAEQLVEAALDEAEAFEYDLEDLATSYLFDPDEFNDPERYEVEEPVTGTVDSLPSLAISYTMEEERGLHHGRKVYVAWDNHLFVFSYLGPEKYLPTFDAMIAGVAFPEQE